MSLLRPTRTLPEEQLVPPMVQVPPVYSPLDDIREHHHGLGEHVDVPVDAVEVSSNAVQKATPRL